MTFAILPALLPNVESIYDVYFSAFSADQMGRVMLDVLFPGGFEGADFRVAHAVATREYWKGADQQYTWKVVDTETGDVAGMILGDVYMKPRSVEERRNFGVPWLEGEHRRRAEAVLDPLWEARERIFGGRPYICRSHPSPRASLTPLLQIAPFSQFKGPVANRSRRPCHRRTPQIPRPQGRRPDLQLGRRHVRGVPAAAVL